MPQSFHYPPILSLVSTPRLSSYQTVFSPSCDSELYGIYVWAQHVVGALYPITQAVEVSLRNSIDQAARRKFGDKWWELAQFNTPATKDFIGNIDKAEKTLTRAWHVSERLRLGLPKGTKITAPVPSWPHDKIVAATDFSTWEFVLRDDFAAPSRSQEHDYLWPRLTGRAFRKYNTLSPSNLIARHKIIDIVHEVREYRNRCWFALKTDPAFASKTDPALI